ncbi:MAG: hypothetical protein JO210_09380 [Acidobacteriaceae bacterium]|nr:hypothetical protein [Acidobacteriaceae bacterium]
MIRQLLRSLAYGATLAALGAAAWAVSAPVNDWTIAGPFGGTARALAIDPQKPDVVLAGGMNSLVFRTRDAGQNWALLDFPKHNLSEVTSLLVDPADSNHYFAGIISADDGGLFESQDEGATWAPVKAIRKFGVRALAASASKPSEFVAGTLEGVWLSEDCGKNWKRISDKENLEMQGISAVAIDSKDPQIIYAGTSHLPWKTTDGGKTWESIHTGMIDDSDVFSIFVNPSNPSDILASACSGIYASSTRGDEWKKLLGIPNTSRRTHVIREDPSGENVIYAGTTTGLYKSMNRGGSWKTLSDTQANHIVFDPSHPGRMYLALEYEGVGRSDNGGETIRLINHGFVDRSISSETRSGDKLFALETQEGETSGIFSSSDRGETWTRSLDVHGLGGVHLRTIAGMPSQSAVLVAASPHHMFKSTDGGMLWKPLPVRLIVPPSAPAPPEKTASSRIATSHAPGHAPARPRTAHPAKPVIKTREVSPSEIAELYSIKKGEQDLLFAATDLGLLMSTDAGEHWTEATIPGSPAASALYSAVDSSGYLAARAATGLFTSKDYGEHWAELRFPLPSSDVNEIAIASGQNPALLVATRLGLYSSADGSQWSCLSGIPASTVTSVIFSGSEGVAYAVEYGRLYQTTNGGSAWKEVPSAVPSLRIRRLWLPDLASGRLYGITSDLGILFRDGV